VRGEERPALIERDSTKTPVQKPIAEKRGRTTPLLGELTIGTLPLCKGRGGEFDELRTVGGTQGDSIKNRPAKEGERIGGSQKKNPIKHEL